MIGRATRVLAAAAVLAGATAAIAMPGPGKPAGARPALAKVTAPLAHSNSRDGQAVLSAANLKPGERRTGEVTVTNRGHEGALYLAAARHSHSALSNRLRVTITDVTGGSPRPLADEPLATAGRCVPLGTFVQSESRTYRFAVEFPRGDSGDNGLAGASASVDYEWLQTAAANDTCPAKSDDSVDVPGPRNSAVVTAGQVRVSLGDVRIAVAPGPYRFSGRRGTTKVGIRCVKSDSGACRGRLELERWKGGQGRGIAMAVGDFTVRTGARKQITLALNQRARRRITTKGYVAVRAYVTARDASGRRHSVAYRDRLLYRR